MTKRAPLVNARAMARKHPQTFEVPSKEEIDEITPGDRIKIATSGKGNNFAAERFWCEVEGRTMGRDTVIDCLVDNELLMSDEHGYRYGDMIKVEPKHVYSIQANPHWRAVRDQLYAGDDEDAGLSWPMLALTLGIGGIAGWLLTRRTR